MILTKENLDNDNLKIYATVNNYKLGDDIKVVDYIYWVDENSEEYEKKFGYVGDRFTEFLKNKYLRG